jgi:hypothetical protein
MMGLDKLRSSSDDEGTTVVELKDRPPVKISGLTSLLDEID